MEKKPNILERIPEPTLRRLPWYLAYLKMENKKGVDFTSSTQISEAINVSSSQIAKDLSLINVSGKTRVGYDVCQLVEVLEKFLGFTSLHKAYIFGVGNLGAALLQDFGLRQYGLEIVAGFDVESKLVGKIIGNSPIYHMDDFKNVLSENDVYIGILTVPVVNAQEVADLLVEGGIRAIWNFTPFRIKVPSNIVVQNTSIYSNLAVMYNRLENNKI